MATDLDAAAEQLYRLVPAEFVVARDRAAAEARTEGDRALAAAIKALRRPTQGAWMVNWLARARPDDLGRLLELGSALRVAQDQMAGDELRVLSRQRHAVVAALAGDARRAAAEAGLQAGDAPAREVEETLNAALADDDTAAAVRAGRLSTALRYSGFGPGTDGPAPSAPAVAPAAPSAGGSLSRGDRGSDDDPATSARRRQREAERSHRIDEAEAALRTARTAAADARRTADAQAQRAQEARDRLDQLRASIGDLETRLVSLREQEGDATQQFTSAEQARKDADRAAADGDARTVSAQTRLDDLLANGIGPDPDL